MQISETETPLHRLETVYRRLIERLSTSEQPSGAFRSIIDAWFFTLEEDVLAEGTVAETDTDTLVQRMHELLEQRLGDISRTAPSFAAALRTYRTAAAQGDTAQADGILAWLAGQANVAAGVKRGAGIKGDIDHFGALSQPTNLTVLVRGDVDVSQLARLCDGIDVESVAVPVAESAVEGLKFSACLPMDLAIAELSERLADEESLRQCLAEPVRRWVDGRRA